MTEWDIHTDWHELARRAHKDPVAYAAYGEAVARYMAFVERFALWHAARFLRVEADGENLGPQ